jgi:hypothetical protein
MSILALNDGTFDISNNKLNVYESNVVLTQNYGINGGITEISSNMFNIINSNVNISKNNPYLGLNNNWTGKNLFNGDISFININTLINSLNTINLRSGSVNISGGAVNISGGSVNISGGSVNISGGSVNISGGTISLGSSNIVLPNIQPQKQNNVVFFDTLTKSLSYGTATSFSDDVSFNNAKTQINSTSVVGLSGGVVNISGGAVNINGGIVNISGGQINIGSALYMSKSSPIYLTNANTFGAGMMDLSRAYLGYGTAYNNAKFICDNVGNTAVDGSGAFFVSSMNGAVISNNGLAIGKSTRTAGYALDVSGSVIINNGNVGIGTTTASEYKLDVAGGDLRVGSSSSYRIHLGNSGVGTYRSAYIYGDGTNMEINNQQNGSLRLNTANSEKMRITADGNVGIGTGNPSAKFQVGTSGNSISLDNTAVGSFGAAIYIDSTGGSSGRKYSIFSSTANSGGGAGKLSFFDESASQYRMVIDTIGNVGIGTTAPAAKLQIHDTSNPKMFLSNGTNRSFVSLMSGNTDIGCDIGSTPIRFMPDNTEKMRITADGNVGIGTTDPQAMLHVKKDIPGDIINKQHNLQFEIGRATGTKAMSFGVMDNGSGVIQVKESGAGYNNLLLNPVSNGTTNNYVGINNTNPSSALDVNGTISTNKMLLRTPDYSTTLANKVYNANNWYTAIENSILISDCVYIITLRYQVVGEGKPWNLNTSFMHFCGVTNSLDPNNNSGAAVPTSLHDGDGSDFQIYVRGKIGSGGGGTGVEFKLNTQTVAGYWDVKAYRII